MKINDQLARRDFLKLVGCGVAAAMQFPRLGKSAAPVFQGLEKSKPNILYIVVDNVDFDYMGGCYGGHGFTPNMDRIAERGVKFTRAYSPTPLCVPSRYTCLTGRYAMRRAVRRPPRWRPIRPAHGGFQPANWRLIAQISAA